jgi:hypothetical protein
MDMSEIIMEGVKEYAEEMDVRLGTRNGRLTIDARNEGGHNGTDVDLVQVLEWVHKNLPQLLSFPWVGLTNDEIMEITNKANTHPETMQMTQNKLKEKNS